LIQINGGNAVQAVQPFHQMGAFKWKAMNLDYELADTPTAPPELTK